MKPGVPLACRALLLAGSFYFCLLQRTPAQSVFLNFDAPGQYTGNFNPWNDVGGSNGGNYCFAENPGAGVAGGGGVSVFQSTDTTAAYKTSSWDFSTNGAIITVSTLIQANGQSSGNKIQLGFMNVNNNGLNNNAGVAFESFRFIPSSATAWSLREQYRSGEVLSETNLGTVNVTVGNWYQFVVNLTNTAGAAGNYTADCALYDFGTNGLTPGANLVTFATLRSNTGQTDITVNALWPAFRAFQNAGIGAWDNFVVFTERSRPLITVPLTNTTVAAGQRATLYALAEGPSPISYAWYTNGILVSGASTTSYTTPALDGSLTNVTVVASNPNGSATSSAILTVLTPKPASVGNLPASDIQASLATLNGQVLSTGNDAPTVTIYYGTVDGGTNAAAWANSVSLGAQTGAFAQTVSGLSSNTLYYFTASAANGAGIAWASPSETFATAGSNSPSRYVAVLTQHNDNARTGENLDETALNIYNVNTNRFGLLYTRPVDDQIYAQPLIITNVSILGRGTRNLVIVATVNDTIYAFDADDPSVTQPYWTRSFIAPPNIVPPRNTDMTGACGGNYNDFSGNIGIVGTPVVDPASGTIYLLARTKEISGTTTNFVQKLHALDVATGAERPGSPVVVASTYLGTGAGSVNGVLTFDPQKENHRASLVLANGIVYLTWSSHCDWGPYHGWVIGYSATNLQQMATYVDTPNGSDGGVWMSGQAPSADAQGNIYLSTGNGTVDTSGTINRGESFLKLTRVGSSLKVSSWFTPYNWSALEAGDIDLGSAGLLLIPGTSLALSGGKQGVLYLVNRDNMGGLSGSTTADTNILQSWAIPGSGHQLHGGPVWWQGPNGSFTYLWAQNSERLRQYQFNGGLFNTNPYAESATVGGAGSPGGILSVSANGTNAGTGIIWATVNTTSSANQAIVAGTLHAYNAQNVTNELWNSDLLPRDSLGSLAKFVPPTIANGKVYMATFSDRLNVYGLFPPPELNITRTGSSSTIAWPTNVANFTLQYSTNLATANWLAVTNDPILSNGLFRVIVPDFPPNTFYRLKD